MLLLFLLVCFKDPLLSAGRMRFSKRKSKTNGPILTYRKAKIRAAFNFTACIYIYICCKVKKLVQDLPFYKLKTGPSYKLKTGPSFCCFPSFVVFWGAFLETQKVSQCVKIVFLQNFGSSKMRYSKRKLHFLFFLFLCWRNGNRNKKKKKWKRPKKPIKRVFKVVIQKCEKSKKMDFWQILPDTYLCQEGRKMRIFVHTICFGQILFLDQNSAKQETR